MIGIVRPDYADENASTKKLNKTILDGIAQTPINHDLESPTR